MELIHYCKSEIDVAISSVKRLVYYLYTASVSRQIKSEDHQSEDGLFDEENEAVCSFIAEALL